MNRTIAVDDTLLQTITYTNRWFPCFFGTRKLDEYINGEFNLHWHDAFEFELVLSGELEYRLQAGATSQTAHLSAGEGLFVNAGTLHCAKQIQGEEAEIFFLILPGDFLKGQSLGTLYQDYVLPIATGSPGMFLSREREPALLDALRDFQDLASKEDASGLACTELLLRIWRLLVQEASLYPGKRAEPLQEARLRKMLRYIAEHYAEHVTVDDIAASAYISRSACFRIFRTLAKKSPLEYLLEVRLLHAAQLLLQTETPVSEIGSGVGFHDPSYFTKLFRERFGVSPRQYRHMRRGVSNTADGNGKKSNEEDERHDTSM